MKLSWLLKRIPLFVILGTPLAGLAGTVMGAPGMPSAWVSSVVFFAVLALILGAVPLLVVRGIVALVARVAKRTASGDVVWVPGLVFVPAAVYFGYLLGTAYGMPARGEAGSEFIPLAIGVFFMYLAVIVAVLALAAGVVWVFIKGTRRA